MMMRGVGSEIVLVDRKADLAVPRRTIFWTPRLGRIPFGSALARWPISKERASSCLRPGPIRNLGKAGWTLLSRNAAIFAEIVPAVLAAAPDTVLRWRRIRSTS